MKKLISFSLIALWFSIASFAQTKEPKTPEEKAEHQTKKLTTELSLSADQSTQVKPVLLQLHQSTESIKSKYASATDKTPMKQELKTARESADSQLKTIFTADQYTKYQSIKEDHKEQGGGKGHGHQHN
jgi:hypothetical protein